MTFVTKPGFQPAAPVSARPVEHFPYFGGRYLSVAASLNGGNVVAEFVTMLHGWTEDLGLTMSRDEIWRRIAAAGESATAADASLDITPTLFGERHDPAAVGSVGNVRPGNTGLGPVVVALCRGVVQNLAGMMTPGMLEEHGVTRILGSGGGLLRNSVMRRELAEVYKLEVAFVEESDACIGAAMAILDK